MYKILLVDDEYLVFEGLKRLIPWQEIGLEIVGQAMDGFSALEFLRLNKVDLLLTDVKMPIMSGLELSEKALTLQPDLSVVFLSGYENFHYAKKALELNAGGYVLKPINYKELIDVLTTTVHQLRKRGDQAARESRYQESLPYLKNDLLHQWLEGETGKDEFVNLIGEDTSVLWNHQFSVAVIEMDDISWKLNNYSTEQKAEMIKKMTRMITDKLEDSRLGMYCKLENYRIAYVMYADLPIAQPHMEALLEEFNLHCSLSITVGLGCCVNELNDVPLSYKEAKEALSYKMFNGKNKILSLTAMNKQVGEREKSYLEDQLQLLFSAISEYRLVDIHDILERLFTLARRLVYKISVYNFALYVVSKLDAFLHSLNEDLFNLLGWELQDLDVLFQFETVDDIESWLRRRVFEVSELLQSKLNKGKRKLIQQIEEYLEQHIEDNITLRELGEIFLLSPNHLGFLFKEESGETYSDFHNRKRMERVKQMLDDPRLKIYQIAERMRYRNMTYFHRQFKDYYGISPGDYRKKKG